MFAATSITVIMKHTGKYRNLSKLPECHPTIVHHVMSNSKSHDRAIVNHVIDYFSTAENPDNRWGKQGKII
jgi:hypothetical protein